MTKQMSVTRLYAVCGVGMAVLFSLALGITLAIALGGCAPTQPYVSTRILGDYRLAWFNDGPDLVISVKNPTKEVALVDLVCTAEPPTRLPLVLSPGEEYRAIGQVMNKDAIFNPCHLEASK